MCTCLWRVLPFKVVAMHVQFEFVNNMMVPFLSSIKIVTKHKFCVQPKQIFAKLLIQRDKLIPVFASLSENSIVILYADGHLYRITLSNKFNEKLTSSKLTFTQTGNVCCTVLTHDSKHVKLYYTPRYVRNHAALVSIIDTQQPIYINDERYDNIENVHT